MGRGQLLRSRTTPNQARATARKKKLRAMREKELAAEAVRRGMTVPALRAELYNPVVKILAAREQTERAARLAEEARKEEMRKRMRGLIYRDDSW